MSRLKIKSHAAWIRVFIAGSVRAVREPSDESSEENYLELAFFGVL